MFVEINTESFSLLPIALSTVGKIQNQGAINRPKGLEHHEFIWVRDGSGDFTVDGVSFVLKAGEGVFIKGGTPRSYHISEGASNFFTCFFTYTLNGDLLKHLGFEKFFRFDVPAFLNKETDALEDFCFGKSNPMSRSAALYSLISELFDAILSTRETLQEKVRHYLESHYSEPITLDMIASSVGYDKYSLCHYYAENCTKSVMTELLDVRLSKSKLFLKYTTEPIEQIGKLCGFDSPSYFSKRFKEKYGKTPSQYRNTVS